MSEEMNQIKQMVFDIKISLLFNFFQLCCWVEKYAFTA